MNLLVLTYHYFHRDRPFDIKEEDHAFSTGIDIFEKHCRQLADADYAMIDPTELEGIPRLPDSADRQILLTIDDGHTSAVELALEPMLKHKITAVLNIIPARVGEKQYLNWSSLRNLATLGFSIQSHSLTHVNLARLKPPVLISELEQSKKTIEDNIGAPVTMLAAPMGRINRHVIDCARDVGYAVIMTSFTGINTAAADLVALKRFQVKSPADVLPLDNYFSPLSSIRLIGAAKNLAKKVRMIL